MLDLIWEPDAVEQFDGVIDYIAVRNASASMRMRTLIGDRVQQLRKFPEIGRPGRVAGTRELVVHPNYIVIYQVTPDAIDILRVLHARQQYP